MVQVVETRPYESSMAAVKLGAGHPREVRNNGEEMMRAKEERRKIIIIKYYIK